MTNLDGMHYADALAYLLYLTKRKTTMPTQPEPKYLHLRRYSLKDREYIQTGGITLAYVQEGNWYKVGAAFCSHRDVYQKDGVLANGKAVGRTLAKQRLWTNPCWIHQKDWNWNLIPSHLTNSWGRAWYDTSLRKGLGKTWELRPKGRASGWSWCGPHTMGYSTPYFHKDLYKKLMARYQAPCPVPVPSVYKHRPTGPHFDRVVWDDIIQWSPGASDRVLDDLFPGVWTDSIPNDHCVDDDVCNHHYDI